MELAYLTIKNFGPIHSAELIVRKYTIFIGDTSAGKSTAAKLLAIFNSPKMSFVDNEGYNLFYELLTQYDLNFEIKNDTYIEYRDDKCYWRITKNTIDTSNEAAKQRTQISNLKEILKSSSGDGSMLDDSSMQELFELSKVFDEAHSSVYIATERMLITQLFGSLMALHSQNMNFSQSLANFGLLYEKAKAEITTFEAPFLNNAKFSFKGEFPSFSIEDGDHIPLRLGSSGVQSIAPLIVVLLANIKKNKDLFVIEEPEQNLYPTNQVEMINWLASLFNKHNEKRLIVTTHSPYVLTAFDNLILGYEAKQAKPDLSGKEIPLPQDSLIDFEEVSSYFFGKDGNVKEIRNSELKNIGAEHLDEVSSQTSVVTDTLTNILYC